jgi:hypothetical protein
VQQTHIQRNNKAFLPLQRSNSGFYIDFFRPMYVFIFSKS